MVDIMKAMQAAPAVLEAIAEIKTGELGKEFDTYLKVKNVRVPWGYGNGYPDDFLVKEWPNFLKWKESQATKK